MEIQPKDPSKNHFYFSVVKSGLRIVAGIFLIQGDVVLGGAFLILAEAFGVFEELV